MFGRVNDGVPPMEERRFRATPRCSISCRAISVIDDDQRRTRSSCTGSRPSWV
jgi:hypothetical protein